VLPHPQGQFADMLERLARERVDGAGATRPVEALLVDAPGSGALRLTHEAETTETPHRGRPPPALVARFPAKQVEARYRVETGGGLRAFARVRRKRLRLAACRSQHYARCALSRTADP